MCSTNGAKCSTEAALGAPELPLGLVDRDDDVIAIATTERLSKPADALPIAGDIVGN